MIRTCGNSGATSRFPAVVTTDPPGADVALSPHTNTHDAGSLSAARRSTASACPAGSSGCGFPRQVFSRLKAPSLRPASATGSIRWTRCRRAWCESREAAIRSGSASSATSTISGSIASRSTNRQFKEFVDRGGYTQRDYWREPFVEGGRSAARGNGPSSDSVTRPDGRGPRRGSLERIPTARPISRSAA